MDENQLNIINNILNYDPKSLKRESGDFQFTDVSTEIESLFNLVNNLHKNPNFFNTLPENQKNTLRNLIQNINDIFSQISNFKPQNIPNPQDTRNNLAQTVKNYYGQAFDFINLFEIFNLKTSGKQATLSNITNEAQQVLQDAKNDVKQIADLVETAKKTTSKIPLYKYLGIFDNESKAFAKKSYIWLTVAFIFAIGLLLELYLVNVDITKDLSKITSTQGIIGFIALKLFYLAIILYVLQQCFRNYMANMHQSVINKHRENSLKVFDAMVKSSNNPDTNDQVLQYLSQSIFDAGETGFFPGKDISKDTPDMIQIIKDANKSK